MVVTGVSTRATDARIAATVATVGADLAIMQVKVARQLHTREWCALACSA
jgi:hypothetical protein